MICGVGTGNTGNDDSVRIATQLFEQLVPSPSFVVATPHPQGAREIVDIPVIPLVQNLSQYRSLKSRRAVAAAILGGEYRRLHEVRASLAHADLVVITGTGIFDDFGERPWSMPYALLSWTVAARIVNRPVAFIAVGAGPIAHRINRAIFGAVARRADSISYRDSESRDYMRVHCRASGPSRVCPDLVFGRGPTRADEAMPTRQKLHIGVGVMEYGGWSQGREGPGYDSYISTLAETVIRLREVGHEITFLVGQPIDVPAVRDVIERCRSAGLDGLRIPDILSFDDLLSVVSTTDLVIATRYHNVVAALLCQRPVISLSYAPKNRALLEQVGLASFDRPVEDADPEWILNRVAELHEGRCRLPDHMDNLLRDWQQRVRAEMTRIVALLGE